MSSVSSRSSAKSTAASSSYNACPLMAAYARCCAKHKTQPVPNVKINAVANSVAVLGDRMTPDGWRVAMDALSADVSTHHVRISNRRHLSGLYAEYDTYSRAAQAPKHVPISGTLYAARTIAAAVVNVLCNSSALVYLQLENVLLDGHSLNRLVSGVKANCQLQHLSLAYSRIGDDASRALCKVLRNKPNVRSLNLTGCALSRSAPMVDLIKTQQYKRQEECWAHSLRSRTANTNIMHGLRRLTLNDNDGLGDEELADVFESLKDDMFLKAVDLQSCGLTDRGAQLALSALSVNDELIVLDLRKNALVSAAMLETVMISLYKNNENKSETKLWKWTRLVRDVVYEASSTSVSAK